MPNHCGASTQHSENVTKAKDDLFIEYLTDILLIKHILNNCLHLLLVFFQAYKYTNHTLFIMMCLESYRRKAHLNNLIHVLANSRHLGALKSTFQTQFQLSRLIFYTKSV